MNFKRVIKWIGYIIGVLILIYILILGVLIYFLAGGDFKNSLIYLSDLQESGLYYGNENRKIADNVVAVHEVDNKLYYITLSGIGIFDENVSFLDRWNKNINSYNTFIPRKDAKVTQFNIGLDELYPNISSLAESDREIWNEIFLDSEKRYTGLQSGYSIKLPFYVSYRKEDLIKHMI